MFHLKIIVFTAVKNCSILHGPVFIMFAHDAMILNFVFNYLLLWKMHIKIFLVAIQTGSTVSSVGRVPDS